MKKLVFLISFITFISILSYSQTVTQKQAFLAAKNFVRQLQDMKKFKPVGRPLTLYDNDNQKIAYIIKLYPEGFVVLSTDMKVPPVKAFSSEGYFDTSSTNPLVILLKAQMPCEYKSANKSKAPQKIIKYNKSLWSKLLSGVPMVSKDTVQYGPSIPSVWGGVNCYDDQGNTIYVGNYYTPKHYSPGCVATSLSQILYRYKWPIHGTGSHTDNDNSGSSTGSYHAFFFGTYYDWNNMLDEYYHKASTDIQQRACGLLQYHCGISLDMDYESNGSTSNINRSPNALSKYWRYVGHYEDITWSNFWSRMDENMEDSVPVQLAIKASNGAGHAIAVDGYRQIDGGDKYYHLNMGWWGDCNAWYRISISYDACGYTSVTGGVFDILPEPELRVADITRTCDNYKVILSWLVSKQKRFDAFELQQSDDGGSSWTTLSNTITDTCYTITFPKTDPIGKKYEYRVRTEYDGHWYVSSYSNIDTVAITDDLTYLDFDGNDSYYVLDNSHNDLDVSNKWTIEAWINIDKYTDNSWSVIMDRRNVFSFYLINDADADYAIRFVARDANDNIIASVRSDNSSVNLSLGQWYHVAVSYDGTTARLFINGQLVDSSTDPDFDLTSSTHALNIGARYWGSYSRYLDGKIDEIRISDTARYTSNFTPDRYLRFKPDKWTRLLMHLDEGGGSDIYDASGNFRYIRLRPSTNDPGWETQSYGTKWTGSNSTDWNDAGNWTAGVPDQITLAKITSDATNMPVITANTIINHLKIEDNATLSVSPGATLTVKGQFCNNGTFILQSPHDSTQSAALVDTSLYSNNYGTCIAYRFLPCCQYSYIGSPIKHATSQQFTNIDQYFNSNFYWYDETKAGDDWMNGWTAAYKSATEPDTLVTMRGYAYYYPYRNLTAEFQGTFNRGTYRINTTYTNGSETEIHKGWNLIANPYPSPIDWDKQDGWIKNNIDNAIYMWNGQNYSYYVGAGGTDNSGGLGINNATNIIPPYQGFFVKATANGYIEVKDRARVSTNHNFYKKATISYPLVILRISDSLQQYDETAIRFIPGATNDFDKQYDAYKLFPQTDVPLIYSLGSDQSQLAINSMNMPNNSEGIKLGINIGKSGDYNIKATKLIMPEGFLAELYDKQLDSSIALNDNTLYTFYSASGDYEDRFILRTETVMTSDNSVKSGIAIFSSGSYLFIKANPYLHSSVTIYNITGKVIKQTSIDNSFTKILLQPSGIYIIKFKNTKTLLIKKVLIQ